MKCLCCVREDSLEFPTLSSGLVSLTRSVFSIQEVTFQITVSVSNIYLRHHLASGEGIVSHGICLSRCVCMCYDVWLSQYYWLYTLMLCVYCSLSQWSGDNCLTGVNHYSCVVVESYVCYDVWMSQYYWLYTLMLCVYCSLSQWSGDNCLTGVNSQCCHHSIRWWVFHFYDFARRLSVIGTTEVL